MEEFEEECLLRRPALPERFWRSSDAVATAEVHGWLWAGEDERSGPAHSSLAADDCDSDF